MDAYVVILCTDTAIGRERVTRLRAQFRAQPLPTTQEVHYHYGAPAASSAVRAFRNKTYAAPQSHQAILLAARGALLAFLERAPPECAYCVLLEDDVALCTDFAARLAAAVQTWRAADPEHTSAALRFGYLPSNDPCPCKPCRFREDAFFVCDCVDCPFLIAAEPCAMTAVPTAGTSAVTGPPDRVALFPLHNSRKMYGMQGTVFTRQGAKRLLHLMGPCNATLTQCHDVLQRAACDDGTVGLYGYGFMPFVLDHILNMTRLRAAYTVPPLAIEQQATGSQAGSHNETRWAAVRGACGFPAPGAYWGVRQPELRGRANSV